MAEQVVPETADDHFKRHNNEQAEGQDIQRGVTPVHQHFVHDHLEEKRCDERKQLQEKRRDDHIPENVPVLHEHRQEPAQVKHL